MVRALIGRIKKVQSEDNRGLVAFEGRDEGLKGVIVEAMKEEMDDTVSVFVDVHRLRNCVIVEIVGALSVHSSGFVS